MKIDILGHASLYVHGADVSVLFDPLLFGVHSEGLYDIYPPRALHLERMPSFDAVIISHAHSDHFDLETIARLPRATPIFAADDGELLDCLEGLGFASVTPLADYQTIRAGELEIIPTPAAYGAREHGFLIRDGDALVWNMVDTFPMPDAIAEIRSRCPAIDVLIAPWQPLLDSALAHGQAARFPFELYARMIETIRAIGPRAVVPGACGFWARGGAAWTNHLLFPTTRERFVYDLARAVPTLAESIMVLEPGDALVVSEGMVSREQGLLDYIECDREAYDWRAREFRPAELAPLGEPRGDDFTPAQCGDALAEFFRGALLEHVVSAPSRFAEHRRWGVVRQYSVVFSGGARRSWTLDLRGEQPALREGGSPLALATTTLPASLLLGLIAGTISWDYAVMSGELRVRDDTYRYDELGMRRPGHRRLVDPLAELLGGAEAREHHLALQVERLLAEVGDAHVVASARDEARPRIDSHTVMREVLKQMSESQVDQKDSDD